jgi:hypothetical protein
LIGGDKDVFNRRSGQNTFGPNQARMRKIPASAVTTGITHGTAKISPLKREQKRRPLRFERTAFRGLG